MPRCAITILTGETNELLNKTVEVVSGYLLKLIARRS
jgi:hypothetical protein